MELSQLPPGFLNTVIIPLREELWTGDRVKGLDILGHLHNLVR